MKRLKMAPDSSLSHSQYQVTGPRIGSSVYSNLHWNMTAQKQRFPSFASTISALGIILYCVGFLRVELELNNQRERLQALENIAETEPPSGDPNIAKFIKVTRGMYFFQCKNFMQLWNRSPFRIKNISGYPEGLDSSNNIDSCKNITT